jgi:acyl transferase domain-containing protein
MTGQDTGDVRELLARSLRQLRETRTRMQTEAAARHEPLAVVGAGVRMPAGADSAEALWRLLRDGVDAVGPLTDRPDGIRGDGRVPAADGQAPAAGGRWASQLSSVDTFDAGFFGVSPPEAAGMDPQQRLLLEVAWEAIEDAGLPVEALRQARTGVFVGVYGADYLMMQLSEPGSISAYTAPGAAHSIAANRLSYVLDLRGPSMAVDTACSSSLIAVHLAARALRQDDCDFALVAGVNLILSPLSTMATERVLPLAPSGRCRTFDAEADGIVRAEGCAVLVLERMSAARRGGRRIRGVVRGTAANHDGRTNGLTAPNPRAQAELMRSALADAVADAGDVVYLEAHGTGTRLGDPIEVEALRGVYGTGGLPCAVGSVKTNFGHQEAAAGIAGLLKAMLVLEHGQVPPHLHLRRLNPEIDLGARLGVPTTLTDLPAASRPWLAAVSSFGFGGANAHVILEAPPTVDEPAGADTPGTDPPDGAAALVLPLSARGDAALGELAARYADLLVRAGTGALDICAAAARGRTHHTHRLCVAAADPGDLVRQLTAAAHRARRPATRPRRVAFVFSGQGSHWPGMGREIMAGEPVVRAEIAACDAVVRELAGWSLVDEMSTPQRRDRTDETEVAQITIAALQFGLAALWGSWGVEPHAVVGHSMGEVVAACVAGALDRRDAFELLLNRARIAEPVARGGAMASIGLPEAEVAPLVARACARVGVAAVNGPRSTTVSGEVPAVAEVVAAARARGARTQRLAVEYAFHSPLLAGCAGKLAAAVAHLRPRGGDLALYSTTTGGRIGHDALDPVHWGRNLCDPVRFHAALSALAADGVDTYVEIGPHPVLLRAMSETLDEVAGSYLAVGSLRRGQPARLSLYQSLADLYAAGAGIRWAAVLPAPRRSPRLPSYPWQRTRHWLPRHEPAQREPAQREAAQREPAQPEPVGHAAAVAAAAPGATSVVPVEVLCQYVRQRLAEAMETGVEAILPDTPLDSLGLNSLTVVELRNQVERELGVAVGLRALLESETPAKLAQAIAGAQPPAPVPFPLATTRSPQP